METAPLERNTALGDGIKEMARAIEGFPAGVSRELQLVERAFHMGNVTGATAAIIFVFLAAKVIGAIRGEEV